MKHVLEFKIVLKDIKPPIWRRIQVPEDYSFWDLHVAIQDAMSGWLDYHLHEFRIRKPAEERYVYIGIPTEEDSTTVLPGWETPITRYFTLDNKKAIYTYDFGDDWKHQVTLEKILPSDPKTTYPICLSGKRRCPPEDCGGPWGYMDFLEAISDPSHPEHKRLLDWVGGSFDPDDFDHKQVQFDDPQARWIRAFQEYIIDSK